MRPFEIDDGVDDLLAGRVDPKEHPEDWDMDGLQDHLARLAGIRLRVSAEDIGEEEFNTLTPEILNKLINKQMKAAFHSQVDDFGKIEFEDPEIFVRNHL